MNASLAYQGGRLFLDGEDVEDGLHTDEVDRYVAQLSACVPIRHEVNRIIRELAASGSVVVEGRDMTSVVFPDAECRFYLDASADARARRRFEQGVSRMSLDEIRESILKRDEIDRHKEEGSLYVAPGVVYIDTSLLTIEQTIGKVYETLTQCKGQNMAQNEADAVVRPEIGTAFAEPAAESPQKQAKSPVWGIAALEPEKVKSPAVKQAEAGLDHIQSQLQEEYLKNLEQLEEGQLVEGTVIQVRQDQVFVNIGYKSEGKIPLSEFESPPKEGDKVTVLLVTKENKRGEVVVSKEKADEKLFWKKLRQAFQDHEPIEGRIDKIVKGGYDVFLGPDAHAFLPISQADAQKVDKAEKLVGLNSLFAIERIYSDGKVNIVVNRRKLMEEELEKRRSDFFANTNIGDDITGVVKSFTSFGAFLDLGGFDGLLHVNDMSWGHVARPRDFVRRNQELRVKVVRMDPVEKRINLSLKHFSDDPWVHFEDKYHVNDIVKGTVTKLAEFGAFIELEEGIEGLAHISEFSWIKKVHRPSDLVKVGDEVECMILGYDLQAGRVSLGLKQVTANPWDGISERYPEGTRLTRKVVKLTNAGAFIELEPGIDGFLHGDDISWTRKIKHPGSELKSGQKVEVIVLECDEEKRSIRLGIKQLSDDPWKSFAKAYHPGSLVEGTVASVTDFGIFVKVPGGIEGLIHKTNLSENRDDDPDEALKRFKAGDTVKAAVLELQPDRQKVSFSIKDLRKRERQQEMSRYMAQESADDSTHTLGDMLKWKGGVPSVEESAPETAAPAEAAESASAAPKKKAPARKKAPKAKAAEAEAPVEAPAAEAEPPAEAPQDAGPTVEPPAEVEPPVEAPAAEAEASAGE
jgi:small subunit ribosomal protein S1